MKITKEIILEEICKMNVLEVVELTKLIEKTFQINQQSIPEQKIEKIQQNETIQEEKKTKDVILENYGTNKIAVIKEVKVITGLGLKEAKDLVESAPVKLKENILKEQADTIKDTLEKFGATIVLK